MIKIEKLRYQNFLSSGNTFTEIKLDEHDILLFAGPNGSGKSTVLDALSFGFYGKAFRNINKPQLVNSITKRKCLVEIEFSNGDSKYLVRRGILPSIFEVYHNGILLNQEAHSKDYQEVLEKQILKIGHKSFCQIVILGIATFKPFMTLPVPQRREVIEDLFDLQVFSSMNALLKDRVSENKLFLNETLGKIKQQEDKISFFKEQVRIQKVNREEIVKDKEEKIKALQTEIKSISGEITNYLEEIQELKNEIKDVDEIKKKKDEASDLKMNLFMKKSSEDNDIEFLKHHDVCNVCGQDIDKDFKIEKIASKIVHAKQIEQGIASLRKSIDKYNLALVEIGEVKEKIRDKKYQCETLKTRIALLYSQISELEKEIEKLSQEQKVDLDGLLKAEHELNNLDNILKTYEEEKELNAIVALCLKDNGIKAKIVKQFIPLLNKFVNKYLIDFEAFWDFEIDENFVEVFRSRFLDEFSYESFSQGERQKIDLSLLFAWRDIAKLRNTASFNLLILDEVFDQNFDDASLEHLLSLIRTLTQTKNLVIISHKNATVDSFENVIRFEKTKNFSHIKGS